MKKNQSDAVRSREAVENFDTTDSDSSPHFSFDEFNAEAFRWEGETDNNVAPYVQIHSAEAGFPEAENLKGKVLIASAKHNTHSKEKLNQFVDLSFKENCSKVSFQAAVMYKTRHGDFVNCAQALDKNKKIIKEKYFDDAWGAKRTRKEPRTGKAPTKYYVIRYGSVEFESVDSEGVGQIAYLRLRVHASVPLDADKVEDEFWYSLEEYLVVDEIKMVFNA